MKTTKSAPATLQYLEVLEPRVMLDANIELSLSDTVDNADTIEAMTALMSRYEEQFDPEHADGLLKKLRDGLENNLDDAAQLFSIGDDQTDTGYGELTDIFERVRSAALQVVEDYKADLSDLVTDNLSDISSSIETELNGGSTLSQVEDLKGYDNVKLNGASVADPFDLMAHLSSHATVLEIFGGDAVWNGDLEARIATYIDQIDIEYDVPPTALTLETNTKDALAERIYDGWIAALQAGTTTTSVQALEEIALTDVADSSGVYISYDITQDLSGADVDNSVTVSVTLPEVETLFSNLDAESDLRAVLPVDFEFPNLAGL